jgi:hypothetical protein
MKLLRDSVRWEGDSECCVGKNLEAGDCDLLRGHGGRWLLNDTVSSPEYSVE